MTMRPRVTRRLAGRRVTRGLLSLAVGVSVLLGASTGRATAAVQAVPHSCAEAPGYISLVVDFGKVGSVAGAPDGVFTACVALSGGDTGLSVLQKVGLAPRLSPAGMICGISGYPTTGCGVPSASNFLYWSYWHGDAGGWHYANTGAGGYRLLSGDVEGWRFIDGQDSSDGVGLTPPRDLAGVGPSYLSSNISGPVLAGTVPPTQPSGGSGGGQIPVSPGATTPGSHVTPGSHGPSGTGASTTTGGVGTTTTVLSSPTTLRGSVKGTPKEAPRITSGESAPILTKTQLRQVAETRGNGVPIGSIVGAIVGVVAILALIAFGIVRAGKRRSV